MTTPVPQVTKAEAVKAIYLYAAELAKKGHSYGQIVRQLQEQGLDQKAAAKVANDITQLQREALSSAARKNMLYGALWCIGGILVTFFSYAAAQDGGTYIVTWGAIVFGAVQFFRGLSQLE
ncbi:MAG: hypothetical protein R3C14_44755 [Caldilineaceae bacterium]